MKSLYEHLGGTYHQGQDGILYPDLLPPKEDAPTYGKYGRMRRTYLKEHRPALYISLLLSGKLNAHLNEIDEAANTQMELQTKQMATAQGVTEELKARDQMAWVGASKRKSSLRFECLPAMCYNLCIVPESLGYGLRLSVIWRLCT